MCNVDDVFAADIHYHDNCCKAYIFCKYHTKIEEIMNNLEIEEDDSLNHPKIEEDDSLKARFLALELGQHTVLLPSETV